MHSSFGTGSSYLLKHDKKGTCLDTAACRTRRCTDKHQNTQYKQPCIGKFANGIGGKTSRSCRNTLKEGSQPCNIFCYFQQNRSHCKQYHTGNNDHFGMKRQFPEASLFQQIQNDQKTQSAKNNQNTGGQKSATTSSTGGLILALKRALLLLAPKGGVASTFTGPL